MRWPKIQWRTPEGALSARETPDKPPAPTVLVSLTPDDEPMFPMPKMDYPSDSLGRRPR